LKGNEINANKSIHGSKLRTSHVFGQTFLVSTRFNQLKINSNQLGKIRAWKVPNFRILAATLKNHGKFSGPNLALKFHEILPQEVI
jgi:hypothetical protein